MRRIDIVLQKICSVLNVISGVILSFLVVLTVLNVAGRFIKHPITGNYEIVEYGFAVVVGFAIAYTAIQDRHIYVELLFDRYPQKVKTVLGIISDVIFTCLFTLITWRLCVDGVEAYIISEKSSTLGIPYYFFQFALAIGFALLTLVILANLIKLLYSFKSSIIGKVKMEKQYK